VDHGLDVGGGEVEIAAGFVQLVGVAAGEFADVLLEPEQALDGLVFALGAGGVQAAALAEHGLLHLLGDDGADFAQVFADLLDLLGGAVEEFQVGGEGGAGAFGEFGILAEAGGDEVVDVHFRRALAVAVDAAVALLQAVGIPGDLVVDEAVAVALEVDAFAGGVGGEQDADGRVLGVELESGFDALAVIGVLRAVEEFQAVAFLEAAGGQVVMEPLLGVAVFGEDNDALLVPTAVGPDHVFEPFQKLVRLAVELGGGALRPAGEVVENLGFGGRWGRKARAAASRASTRLPAARRRRSSLLQPVRRCGPGRRWSG
jgi:hypothetical protein